MSPIFQFRPLNRMKENSDKSSEDNKLSPTRKDSNSNKSNVLETNKSSMNLSVPPHNNSIK
jgi:hypothetical protein